MTVGAAKTTTAATSEVLTWTPTHEARLSYVQQKLKAAQAAWSEEQGLWIDEVRIFLPLSLQTFPFFSFFPPRSVRTRVFRARRSDLLFSSFAFLG